MKKTPADLLFSPSDLNRYLASPFASWMDRYYLENHDAITPDPETEDQKLIAETGNQHEHAVLEAFESAEPGLVKISQNAQAREATLTALEAKAPIIFQAALHANRFAGYADFLILGAEGSYQVWDTKLARSPKPYYAIQLCCYSEMLAHVTNGQLPEIFGIILGTKDRVEFRLEDFIHYYQRVKENFLAMQDTFTGNLTDRPEPLPRADHGRWTSHAEEFFLSTDHLVQIAGITTGQIKKLHRAGVMTMTELAQADDKNVPRLAADSLSKLSDQARLQCQTRDARARNADASSQYEVLPTTGLNGEPVGLAALPVDHPADVFFDMEGYPLVVGGLEYLFGAWVRDGASGTFMDWWAHDRAEEKLAFEGFVDWVFKRWQANPGMHIYHYAAYEVSAVRRLSTRHDTRQDEVDTLLRNGVFTDLYQIIRHGLRIGEDSYSIKKVERLYRPKRATDVATAVDSIVQYARWMQSGQAQQWSGSTILKDIRDYNEDDCVSTAELLEWLRRIAAENRISPLPSSSKAAIVPPPVISPEATKRLMIGDELRKTADVVSSTLGDLIDFHRREEKPIWWRMFERAEATPDALRDDPGCIEGIKAEGSPSPDKKSFLQHYRFDPLQECKLASGDKVMFSFELGVTLSIVELDIQKGKLCLKVGKKTLDEKLNGEFPAHGSLIPVEFISAACIQAALSEVAGSHLRGKLPRSIKALLERTPPSARLQRPSETSTEAAIRVAAEMKGGCLVIQGPPGTGKTFTASRMIHHLLAAGKKVGISSNSHKAVINLLSACHAAAVENDAPFQGIKVGGEKITFLTGLRHVQTTADARSAFNGGVVGGTAWLFTRPEWTDALDYLFIDEAGQVSLANATAMARCTANLILLGDQMQLEQPIQGSHPGNAGLSALQYALMDPAQSKPDAPAFHAVVPSDYGIFLNESRRMHPDVCSFISGSIYQGGLRSHPDCSRQSIAVPPVGHTLVGRSSGIVFSGLEHDGNVQQSDEEVERVTAIYDELLGREYTDKAGVVRPLALEDFLFIAPYNAQVRALQAELPDGARVGSVDKFQGQEAPVCILSLCSSFGDYGSRGLAFILDRNRINVAISRAQCLAIVVADPRIAGAEAVSLEEMKLINLLCKLVKG